MRFQAQHLRKIRIPKWSQIPTLLKDDLIRAGKLDQRDLFDELAFSAYQLTPDEKSNLGA